MLAIEIAVAKVPKYAVRESGDSVEVVERPHGGLSVVMVDGQRSGQGAKAISNIAVRKAISLLAEGVRDGAVARATHDYLRTQRGGQVSAELTMISLDLETRTVVISRNGQCPVWLAEAAQQGQSQAVVWRALEEPAEAVGVRSRARPAIAELPLAAGQTIVAYTDGVMHAGQRRGEALRIPAVLATLLDQSANSATQLADALLESALSADEGRPADDTTVVVVRVVDKPACRELEVRRMAVSFPVPPV